VLLCDRDTPGGVDAGIVAWRGAASREAVPKSAAKLAFLYCFYNLDTLNIMNKVALQLDTDFLSTVEEEPTFDLGTQDREDTWARFKKQSYHFYNLMATQGNRFYLTHKVDKRGRIYAHGYHINTQGSAFKKAMLELADVELIKGVPAQ
jgi:hypothetical protein